MSAIHENVKWEQEGCVKIELPLPCDNHCGL